MLLLPHTIVGATIAAKIGSPWLALPLAFISHFATDLLPHWNPHLNQEMETEHHLRKSTRIFILVDTCISLIVGSIIAGLFLPDIKKTVVVLLGCFLGILPDLFESPYFFFGIKNKYLGKLMKIQKKIQWNLDLPWGVLTQVVVVAVCFWLLLS